MRRRSFGLEEGGDVGCRRREEVRKKEAAKEWKL